MCVIMCVFWVVCLGRCKVCAVFGYVALWICCTRMHNSG